MVVVIALLLLLFAAMTGMALIGPGYSNQSQYTVATDTKHPAHKSMMLGSDEESAFLLAQEPLVFGHGEKDWWYLTDGIPADTAEIQRDTDSPSTQKSYSAPGPESFVVLKAPGEGSRGYPRGGSPYVPSIVTGGGPSTTGGGGGPTTGGGGGPSTTGGGNTPSGPSGPSNSGGPGQDGNSSPDPDTGNGDYPSGNGKTASVPEPASLAIMLLGLAGIGVAMLRKFRRPA